MENSALAVKPRTDMERIKGYLMSPEVKERFSEMMGSGGIYYLNQVLIVVANSPRLQKCTPQSILIAAMRAASLRLSVDSVSGQAWIIPYKEVATFQIGYRGVYELALRTGLYRFINVITVFDGEEVVEDRMTGIHRIEGRRASDKITGYMLYFQLLSGFEKTYYMTLKEIAEHAGRYSASYNDRNSLWNGADRPKMEQKTVLMNGLRKWGRFNPSDAEMLDQIETEQGWHDPEAIPDESEVTVTVDPPQTVAESMSALGFDEPQQKPVKTQPQPDFNDPEAVAKAESVQNSEGVPYGCIPSEKLQHMLNALEKIGNKRTAEQAEKHAAARLILTARAGGKTTVKAQTETQPAG